MYETLILQYNLCMREKSWKFGEDKITANSYIAGRQRVPNDYRGKPYPILSCKPGIFLYNYIYTNPHSHLIFFTLSAITVHRLLYVFPWSRFVIIIIIISSIISRSIIFILLYKRSRCRLISITTTYGLNDRGVTVRALVGSRIFSSPRRPGRLWGPHNLLYNGYRGLFPREYSGRGVKLTTHLQLVPRSIICGSIYPLPHTPSWCSA
jgi:hypothetical protein